MKKNGTPASPSDGASAEQGLAGAGRADHQRAFRYLASEALKLGRVLQEVDDLGRGLRLALVHAGDVLEGDAVLILGEQPGLGLAKAHRAARPALHLAHEQQRQAEQQQQRGHLEQERQQEVRAVRRERGLDVLVGVEVLLQHQIVLRPEGPELVPALVGDDDRRIADVGLGDVAGVDLGQHLRVGDVGR